MNIRKILYWIPVLIIMITIFCFSSQNAETSSQTSGGFSEILARLIYSDFENKSNAYQMELINRCQFFVRKTAHFSIYAVMGFFSFIAFRQYDKVPKKQLFAAILCLVYSISDEIHQSFIPGRSCELRDVFIDFSGAVTGIAFLSLLLMLYNRRKNRKP